MAAAHHHHHDHARDASARRLLVGLSLIACLMAVEVVAGILASSPRPLPGADRSSMNVEGAFQHVVTDLAAFVATAVAGVVILATGFDRADPIASLLVAALMLRAAYGLLRASGRVFLEAAPEGSDPTAIGRALAGERGVVEVHDLHVWAVGSGFPALSAHVLVGAAVDCHAARRRLESLLHERFQIDHTTLQVDHAALERPVTIELPRTN